MNEFFEISYNCFSIDYIASMSIASDSLSIANLFVMFE
jgi:hypothetical protein